MNDNKNAQQMTPEQQVQTLAAELQVYQNKIEHLKKQRDAADDSLVRMQTYAQTLERTVEAQQNQIASMQQLITQMSNTAVIDGAQDMVDAEAGPKDPASPADNDPNQAA